MKRQCCLLGLVITLWLAPQSAVSAQQQPGAPDYPQAQRHSTFIPHTYAPSSKVDSSVASTSSEPQGGPLPGQQAPPSMSSGFSMQRGGGQRAKAGKGKLQKLFAYFDANHDGRLDSKEAALAVEKIMASPRVQSRISKSGKSQSTVRQHLEQMALRWHSGGQQGQGQRRGANSNTRGGAGTQKEDSTLGLLEETD